MKDQLIEVGLDEGEAKVYLQLLKQKNQTANEIAKESKINRSVVYSILEKLIEKGLASYILTNNIKHFSANNPKTLMGFLKDKEKVLKNILPKLKEIQPTLKDLVSVEVFQGIKGGISILKDIIRTRKDYVVLGEDGTFQNISKTLFEQYIRQVNKKKIKERILAKEGVKIKKGKYSKVKYLPKKFNLPTITTIYGNKVAIVIFQEPYYIILIKSKDLADTYKAFFENLWKVAKR